MDTEIGVVDCYALQQELRTVIEEKTRLAERVGELQRELEKLQQEHEENNKNNNNNNNKNDKNEHNNENMHDKKKNALVGMGIAAAHIKMLEKENKMLRAKYLLHLNHEQREQQQKEKQNQQQKQKQQWTQVNELSLQSKMESETLIDSVRISSPGLIRALRGVFRPGRFSMANGAEVSIEYNNEYIIIRGFPPSRHMFMALLLHAIVKHINTTTESQEPNPISHNPHTMVFSQQEEKEKQLYIFQKEKEKEEEDIKMREEIINGLHRAVKVERVEREKAEVAKNNAERECTLKAALLRSERDNWLKERYELEKRVEQLEEKMMIRRRKRRNTQQIDVRSSSSSIQEKQEEEKAQKQRKQGLYRGTAKAIITSVPRHDTYLDNLLERNESLSSSPLLLSSSSSPERQQEEKEERSRVSISRTPYRNQSHGKSVKLAIPIRETKSAENDLMLLKRETELLRNEKKRLLQQVDMATSVAQQQRDRLQSIENIVNQLCRRVLSTSGVTAAIMNETETQSGTLNIWGKTLLPHLILYRSNTGSSINSIGNSGVEEQRVRALVHSLNNRKNNSNKHNNDNNNDDSCIEQHLTDLAVLLEIEQRAVRAALEFAVHERDAALQAQREEKLLSQGGTHTKHIIVPSQEYDNTSINAPVNRSVPHTHNNNNNNSGGSGGELQLAALAKENVTLRCELQQCFDDIQRLAKVIEQSQDIHRELQEKLRRSDEHLRQKEDRMWRQERQHTRELMVEREKERSLELRLERLQQEQQKQSQQQSQLRQLNVVDLSSNTHPIQQSHSPRGVQSHLVSTPARSYNTTTTGTTTAETSIIKESRNYNTHNTSRGMNTLNDFTVTPIKGSAGKMMEKEKDGLSMRGRTLATSAKYSPSMILRKENFEKALDGIHPR